MPGRDQRNDHQPPLLFPYDPRAFGDRIRELRQKHHWTQAELALLVDIDTTGVSRHEHGQRRPQPDTLRGYAAAFGMSVDELVEGVPLAPRAAAQLPPDRPWTAGEVFATAVDLDRSEQWRVVEYVCQGPLPAYFLLYGCQAQSLGLFIERLHHALDVRSRGHQVSRLELADAHETGADWEAHLADVLRQRLPPEQHKGRMTQLLQAAARYKPLMLVLEVLPEHRFDGVAQNALRELLVHRLPRLIKAAASRNPVRLLVAVTFREDGCDVHETIHRWLQAAESEGVIRYYRLRQVELPGRADAETFLHAQRPPLATQLVSEILDEYEAFRAAKGVTFAQLAGLLDERIKRLRPPPSDTKRYSEDEL